MPRIVIHELPFGDCIGVPMSSQGPTDVVLVVDLDGTLLKTDLLAETATRFLVEQPFRFFNLLVWLITGKSSLKLNLAREVDIDVRFLPYNHDVLTWLHAEKDRGRRIVLATASHRVLADQVAAHLEIFADVHASDGTTNLKGSAKRDELVSCYGERGFDYVGNGWADVPVWQTAATVHVVSNSKRLIKRAGENGNLGVVMGIKKPMLAVALFKAMRPHQWIKNLLVFIPLLAASQYMYLTSASQALLAMIVFSLTASSVYLLNDLVDVPDDRHHARKRKRPFASGDLNLLDGWIAWPILLVLAFLLAGPLGGLSARFIVSMIVYFALTVAYSLWLKQIPIVDVLTLAGLYTLRIIAGAAAIAAPLSFWLLSFSMFLFLSLAFIKRYSELHAARNVGEVGLLNGRGYEPKDLDLVSNLGGSASYTAVLVLALYIQDAHTANLYRTPTILWLACPLLLFWISRAWLIAHRGEMHDDPIVFALKDRISWAIVALFSAIFVLAKVVS